MFRVLAANRKLIRELNEKRETLILELRAKRQEKKDIDLELKWLREDIKDVKGDWHSL